MPKAAKSGGNSRKDPLYPFLLSINSAQFHVANSRRTGMWIKNENSV